MTWLRNLIARIRGRLRPIAPFVLEIADQLQLNPEHFLAYTDGQTLTLRAVEGRMARQGVILVMHQGGVRLQTAFFDDVALGLSEKTALCEAIEDWIEDEGTVVSPFQYVEG
jgi:hypothetical protein